MCVCFQTFHRRQVRVLVTVRACICRPFSSRLSGRAPQDLHIHLKGLQPMYSYHFLLYSADYFILHRHRIFRIQIKRHNQILEKNIFFKSKPSIIYIGLLFCRSSRRVTEWNRFKISDSQTGISFFFRRSVTFSIYECIPFALLQNFISFYFFSVLSARRLKSRSCFPHTIPSAGYLSKTNDFLPPLNDCPTNPQTGRIRASERIVGEISTKTKTIQSLDFRKNTIELVHIARFEFKSIIY